MSPGAALNGDILLTYVQLIFAVLGGTGLLLVVLTYVFKRETTGIARTYHSWLIIAPIVLAVIVAGRTATIVGVALLALFGFKEFARATGLYRDWWMSGAVYVGILGVSASSLIADPKLDVRRGGTAYS